MKTMLLLLSICTYFLLVKNGGSVDIEIGRSINLLKNYGLLMRIFPSNENHFEFLKDEFSLNIFNKNASKTRISEEVKPKNSSVTTWNIKVHENVVQILDDIFSEYRIEFVDNNRLAFSTFWPFKTLSDFLGLSHYYFINNKYSFLLVKHKRCSTSFQIAREVDIGSALDTKFSKAVEQITPGDVGSALNFISQYGSHFVASYTTGLAVYQVFHYLTRYYRCFSEHCRDNCQITDLLRNCKIILQLKSGLIKTQTDSKSLEDILDDLNKTYRTSCICNLKNSVLLNSCDPKYLDVTSFNLVSIDKVIKNKEKATFLREVIDNQMKLREISLQD